MFDATAQARLVASTVTGADGRAQVPGLSPGHYAACLGTFFATTTRGSPVRGYADRCSGTTFSVVVRSGRATRVRLEAMNGAVVTGRVTDTSGHPVSGVFVHAGLSAADDHTSRPGNGSYIPYTDPLAYSVTDAHGRYRIRSVAPGKQLVCFDARDRDLHSRPHYRNQCVGGEPGSLSSGRKLTIRTGTCTVNIQLTSSRRHP